MHRDTRGPVVLAPPGGRPHGARTAEAMVEAPSGHAAAAVVAAPRAPARRGALRPAPGAEELPVVSVTTVKAYFKQQHCGRYLALSQLLRADPQQQQQRAPQQPQARGAAAPEAGGAADDGADAAGAAAAAGVLDPALAEAGERQEEDVLQLVEAWLRQPHPQPQRAAAPPAAPARPEAPHGGGVHNPSGREPCPWDGVAAALPGLAAARGRAAWREVQLPPGGVAAPGLGVRLSGRIDFLLLTYESDEGGRGDAAPRRGGGAAAAAGRPVLVVVECKSSQRPDTSHYAQLACYRLALGALLRGLPPRPGADWPALAAGLRCALVTAGDLPHALRRRSGGGGARAPPVGAAAAAGWVDALAAAAGADATVAQVAADVAHQLRPGGAAATALRAGLRARRAGAGPAPKARAAAGEGAEEGALPDLEDLPFSLGAHCAACPPKEAAECGRRCEARAALQLAGANAAAVAALAACGARDLQGLAAPGVGGAALPPQLAALPGLAQQATRARLLLQARGAQAGAAPPQVAVHRPDAASSALPPHAAGVARTYLVCEFDSVSQRVAALAAHVVVGSCGSGGAAGGAREEGQRTPLRRLPGGWTWAAAARAGGSAATFVRAAPDAYATSGGASASATSSGVGAAWAAASAEVAPPAVEVGGAAALSAKKDDMREALLIADAYEQLLAACGAAPALHLFSWAAPDLRRLAARCYCLLRRPGVAGAARLVAALRGVLLLLGGRGVLAGLPGAEAGEQCTSSSLQQELVTRYITPHLRPTLFDAAALRWRAGGAPFSWALPVQAPGQAAPSDAGHATLVEHAARWGSHAPPAVLEAYWMGQQQQQQQQQGHASPQLPDGFAPYAAAAEPGRFEALLASMAEALAHVEGEMQAAGGCNPGIAKPPLPALAAARPRSGGGDERRAGDAAWSALEGPEGLARAALEAVRLDRGGALQEWLADACRWGGLCVAGVGVPTEGALCDVRSSTAIQSDLPPAPLTMPPSPNYLRHRPLAERIAAGRSMLLRAPSSQALGEQAVEGVAVTAAQLLSLAAAGSGDRAPAAANAGAGDAPPPFARGDFVRVTGVWARELPRLVAGLGRSGGDDGDDARGWLERRGANCIVAAVSRDAATGGTALALEPARVSARGAAPARLRHYHLPPHGPPAAFAFDYYVVDAGVAEYVGCSVDAALTGVAEAAAGGGGELGGGGGEPGGRAARARHWLSLLARGAGAGGGAGAPGGAPLRERAGRLLAAARWPQPGGREGRLQPDQARAVAAGLPVQVQLIQGPPGTGKTEALAAAAAAALLLQPGCARVGVTSHTHSAIDNVLARIAARRGAYCAAAAAALGPRAAAPLEGVQLARMLDRARWEASELPAAQDVARFDASYLPVWLRHAAAGGPLVLAASPNDLLKLADKLGEASLDASSGGGGGAGDDGAAANGRRGGKGGAPAAPPPSGLAPLDLLIVDEASMLPFPAALALAARLLAPCGRLVLAGDHRQLAAIAKYGFESDLRPSVVLHGAHASAYDYVHALARAGAPHVLLTQLSSSWRFVAFDELRALIASVYRRDGLHLTAAPGAGELAPQHGTAPGGGGGPGAARPRGRPPRVAAAAPVGRALAGALGGAAAAALSAAGGEVLPGLLGTPLDSGLIALGARGYGGAAAVGAMALELSEDEASDDAWNNAAAAGGPGSAAAGSEDGGEDGDGVWRRVWEGGARLVLVVHDEAASAKHNPLEVEVVRRIMQAAPECVSSRPGHVAVMSPHRAQCAALRRALAPPSSAAGAASPGAGGGASGDPAGAAAQQGAPAPPVAKRRGRPSNAAKTAAALAAQTAAAGEASPGAGGVASGDPAGAAAQQGAPTPPVAKRRGRPSNAAKAAAALAAQAAAAAEAAAAAAEAAAAAAPAAPAAPAAAPAPAAAAAAGSLPAPFKVIDTVEKLQGREAPVVLFSATASAPAVLAAGADFYASLARANVALSRARERLVVVASSEMLSFAPGAAGAYRDLTLWKELRAACGAALGRARVGTHGVRVFAAAPAGGA
ncbi:MAG: hypothetical protein J3K34DRAFT_487149 [Monoraphidium minutum]|nr:MAG: hypothetical protein J3K34DRAFT_487149 [Monoraphidium minutum]